MTRPSRREVQAKIDEANRTRVDLTTEKGRRHWHAHKRKMDAALDAIKQNIWGKEQ